MTDLDGMRLQRIAGRLLEPYASNSGPGMTIGVVQEGALSVHASAGLASIELGVPIGPGPRFRIASVSKQFTCAAVLLLAAEGRLDSGRGAEPSAGTARFRPRRSRIDQLMHNTSGLRDMLEMMRMGGIDLGMPVHHRRDLMAGDLPPAHAEFPAGQPLPLQQHQLPAARPLIVERLTGEPLGDFLAGASSSRSA